MIANLAYLTSPAPGRYLLNIQSPEGVLQRIEISKAQLGNIVVDGAGMALRANDINVRLQHFIDDRGAP